MATPIPPPVVRNPKDAPLRLPLSRAQRTHVLTLGQGNPVCAMAAALGLCWHGPGRVRAVWSSRDPSAYGDAVIDELLERDGVELADIIERGAEAFRLIAESMIDAPAVEAAEGNFAAPSEV